MHITTIDYAILGAYFVLVLGIGFYLKNRMRKSSDFLLAGRKIPVWATGLAFIPLREECYDFVVPRRRRDRPAVRAFVGLLAEPATRQALRGLGFLPPEVDRVTREGVGR